jgi:hypothetical protein
LIEGAEPTGARGTPPIRRDALAPSLIRIADKRASFIWFENKLISVARYSIVATCRILSESAVLWTENTSGVGWRLQ